MNVDSLNITQFFLNLQLENRCHSQFKKKKKKDILINLFFLNLIRKIWIFYRKISTTKSIL